MTAALKQICIVFVMLPIPISQTSWLSHYHFQPCVTLEVVQHLESATDATVHEIMSCCFRSCVNV